MIGFGGFWKDAMSAGDVRFSSVRCGRGLVNATQRELELQRLRVFLNA
jgi:hypothetical protein